MIRFKANLYLKLFLWFWLTLISMLLIVLLLPRFLYEPFFLLPQGKAEHMHRFVEQIERKAQRHERLPPGEGKRWFLIDPEGEMPSRPLPDVVISLLMTSATDGRPRGVIDDDWFYAGPWTAEIRGKAWQVVTRRPMKDTPLPFLPTILAHPWSLFGSVLVLSGLLCGLLAWRLGRPLHQLRRVSQRLASGDLEARPEQDLLRRGDEVGQLSRQLSDMADAVSTEIEAQHQLLRDVSHELRSPLTRLQLAIGLMRRSEGESSLLSRIESESLKLEEMIAELLQLARMQRRSASLEPVDLFALLSSVVDDATIEANHRHLTLTLHGEPQVHYRAEPLLLTRAIDNLLRNAIRYATQRIETSLRLTAEYCEIRVEDDGPGVPDNQLQQIFRPFYRLDDARTPELNGGIGLGMAIVAAAVEAHAGEVMAQRSELGGLCVTIRLPLLSEY
ncbi:HAMP domain-containing protein [Corallincola holothuriorum]|uniref:histidine kinase n=1 Tax=Corallincola holothuriorum TaxID=2282215 RepID=A0A368NNB9_9GAMM|nr:ATP-binding protein [Corallincola holothuriorum]RCU50959.1 HAMP domain-containing protein [Corallincola holothuriorum]